MEKKYLVTGGSGMVGTSLKQLIPNSIFISSYDYDLRKRNDAFEIFYKYKPDYCIHLAARVGGIKSNMNNVGDFFLDNIKINTNILEAAKEYSISYKEIKNFKLVSTLSTCVYPDNAVYPLTEEQIHNGEPHSSNFGYAYAKRMLDVQTRAFRKQYGCNFITVIFNNLIGENDNYDLENSHVIPAIIRKIYEAKMDNKDVIIWGNGTAEREFTYSMDVAKILLFVLENYDSEYPLNVGNTNSYNIKQIVDYIVQEFEFKGNIVWDNSQPTGQMKKPSSNDKLIKLGWKQEDYTNIKIVIKNIVKHFVINYPNLRGI